jgi:hypothetical protein
MHQDLQKINDLLNMAEAHGLEVEAMATYVSARTDGKDAADAATKAMAEWDLTLEPEGLDSVYSFEDFKIKVLNSGFEGEVNLVLETAYQDLAAARAAEDDVRATVEGSEEPAIALRSEFFPGEQL